MTVAILVTACVGPTASETPAPYFETPDRTGACDLIVAMALCGRLRVEPT